MEGTHTERALGDSDAPRAGLPDGVGSASDARADNTADFDSATDGEHDELPDDGRTLRRTRNREAVVLSLLGLIREGEMEPSVAQIADRANVSHRSIFRYFEDLNALLRTAVEHELRTTLPLATIPEIGHGSLERRVDSLVDARLRVCEATHEIGRVARARAGAIPEIDESLRVLAELNRSQLRSQFAAELAERTSANAEFVLDSSMVLTSFESYDMHARVFNHGTERIRLVWNGALLALLRP